MARDRNRLSMREGRARLFIHAAQLAQRKTARKSDHLRAVSVVVPCGKIAVAVPRITRAPGNWLPPSPHVLVKRTGNGHEEDQ